MRGRSTPSVSGSSKIGLPLPERLHVSVGFGLPQLAAPVTIARRTGTDLTCDGYALAAKLPDTPSICAPPSV